MIPAISDFHSNQIEIRGLVKKYRRQSVLDHLCLTIEDGAFCVLVGANGAGKTTLLRILASLVRPDAGEICFGEGLFVFGSPEIRRQIGFVGHQTMFYNDLTAEENLDHYARLFQLKNRSVVVRAGLASMGLDSVRKRLVRTFSRGMRQRLAIGRVLLHDPTVLLLDEPYTGLDQEAALILDSRLSELHHQGRVIVLAAHRPERLLNLASHFAWLRFGQISQHLPVDRLEEDQEFQRYLKGAA